MKTITLWNIETWPFMIINKEAYKKNKEEYDKIFKTNQEKKWLKSLIWERYNFTFFKQL